MAASCVDADADQTSEIAHSDPESRITKREAFVVNKYLERLYPKPIYRRIQQAPPKSKYRPRPHYKTNRPPKLHRKPGRKYKGYHNGMPTKYYPSPPKHKRTTKPKYGPRPKPRPPSYNAPSITGFGEPPADYGSDYQASKQSYGEPPTDSYGAPLNSKVDEYDYNRQTYPVWANDEEASFGFSNKPPIIKPEQDDSFVKRIPQEFNDGTFRKRPKDKNYYKKKKPQYFNDMYRLDKRKKVHKDPEPEQEDEIIVGGRYAEPPPRYVAKLRDEPRAPVIDTDEEFSPLYGFVSSKLASPYVNYKNSNMAFSPQNLNDAFSLVDV